MKSPNSTRPEMDLCIVHEKNTCQAKKFSLFIDHLDSKDCEIIVSIYDIFNLYGFYCPEIGFMKDGRGIRLRYKDELFCVNITLMSNSPNKLFYTIMKNGETEEYTSGTSKNEIVSIIKPFAHAKPKWGLFK